MIPSYPNDRVERYLYEVAKHLPAKDRGEVRSELREMIDGMLEERFGPTPSAGDIDVVLKELGAPIARAEKFRTEGRSLIGPALYPHFIFLLKIVIAATAGGVLLGNVLALLTGDNTQLLPWVGSAVTNTIIGAMVAFAFVTLIFALFQWRGSNALLKVMENDMWSPSSLPPVPQQKNRIKKSESVAGIVASTLLIAVFIFVLPNIGAGDTFIGGGIGQVTDVIVSIFRHDAFLKALPLIVISFALGIVREAAKLIEGSYTRRLTIGIILLNIASMILCFVVFYGFDIWNPAFPSALASALDMTQSHDKILMAYRWFVQYFGVLIALGFLVDTAQTLYSYLRYGRGK